jgi:hypothetical protein
MAGGERYQRFQRATHRDRHAVLYIALDRFTEGAKFAHGTIFYLLGIFNSMLGS